MHIASKYTFQYVFYIQKSTHFIHKSIQYYIKIIDRQHKNSKFSRASTINGLWAINPAIYLSIYLTFFNLPRPATATATA